MSTVKKSQKSQKKQVKDGGELNSILSALALTVGAVVARKKKLALPKFKGGNVEGNVSSYTSSGSDLKGGAKKSKPKRRVRRGGEGEEEGGDAAPEPYASTESKSEEQSGGKRRSKSARGKKRGGDGEGGELAPQSEEQSGGKRRSKSARGKKRGGDGDEVPVVDREVDPPTSGGARRRSAKGKKRGGGGEGEEGFSFPSLTSQPEVGGPIPGVAPSTGQAPATPFVMPTTPGGGKRKSSAKKVTRKRGGAPDLSELLKSLRDLN